MAQKAVGWLAPLAVALQFLTRAPAILHRPFTPPELGRAVGFFPLVGLLLGAVLALLDWGLTRLFPPAVTAALLLAAWILLTGALHLDGLLDACDGLLGGWTPEQRLEILRDERVGAFAVAGGVLVLLAMFAALESLSIRTTPLLLAAVLGRWAMGLALVHFPYVRPQGLGRAMKDHAGRRELFLGSVTAGVISLGVGGWWGAGALVLALLVTWLAGRFAVARIGGLTGDLYGATCVLVETAVLLWFTAGSGGIR
ncbi:adenosylcobinamide-GDP ribazoletransferase [Litorilinea aerophila]|uniref:Adenosylcobinamide-GDP ribazoletransferase n=1 Tax=Litorilinea aerophila TaxID=1204385 RepID=A0A540VJM5_9CHLR|nr:adenosylcobinamide-GDP ribazoletransferase [Litorilinea aerophila]MCC9075395.1 adenosylcobinamide-GDP ribazoletransferase [Litorilinea aerophila]